MSLVDYSKSVSVCLMCSPYVWLIYLLYFCVEGLKVGLHPV